MSQAPKQSQFSPYFGQHADLQGAQTGAGLGQNPPTLPPIQLPAYHPQMAPFPGHLLYQLSSVSYPFPLGGYPAFPQPSLMGAQKMSSLSNANAPFSNPAVPSSTLPSSGTQASSQAPQVPLSYEPKRMGATYPLLSSASPLTPAIFTTSTSLPAAPAKQPVASFPSGSKSSFSAVPQPQPQPQPQPSITKLISIPPLHPQPQFQLPTQLQPPAQSQPQPAPAEQSSPKRGRGRQTKAKAPPAVPPQPQLQLQLQTQPQQQLQPQVTQWINYPANKFGSLGLDVKPPNPPVSSAPLPLSRQSEASSKPAPVPPKADSFPAVKSTRERLEQLAHALRAPVTFSAACSELVKLAQDSKTDTPELHEALFECLRIVRTRAQLDGFDLKVSYHVFRNVVPRIKSFQGKHLAHVQKWARDLVKLVHEKYPKAVSQVVKKPEETGPHSYQRFLDHLVKPFKLIHDVAEYPLAFTLTPELFNEMHKETTRFEFPLILQINGSLAEDSAKKPAWPESLQVYLNGRALVLEKKKSMQVPGRQGTAYVGKDKPVNITSLCKVGQNMVLFVSPSCVCNYLFSLDILQPESEETVVQRANSSILTKEDALAILRKTLEPGDDELEVIGSGIKVSLDCPLSLMRIRTPIRGKACDHLQCFDLNSFLGINKSKPSWKCPVCNKNLLQHELMKDSFFETLLQVCSESVKFVEIDNEGNFSAVDELKNERGAQKRTDPFSSKGTPVPKSNATEVSGPSTLPLIKVKEEPGITKEPIVISLLSDSEDDEEPPPRPPKIPRLTPNAESFQTSQAPTLQAPQFPNESPSTGPIPKESRPQLGPEEPQILLEGYSNPIHPRGQIVHNNNSNAAVPETNQDWLNGLPGIPSLKIRPALSLRARKKDPAVSEQPPSSPLKSTTPSAQPSPMPSPMIAQKLPSDSGNKWKSNEPIVIDDGDDQVEEFVEYEEEVQLAGRVR